MAREVGPAKTCIEIKRGARMRPQTVFFKTAKGHQELNQRRGDLPLRDRRVLMLVNGERNLEEIGRLAAVARVDDYSDILENLTKQGYVEYSGAPKTTNAELARHPQPGSTGEPAPELNEIQKFMLTTLQAFTNRIRVAGLTMEIANAQSAEELRAYLEPWYDAISESPEGIFRADGLRAKLLEMLVSSQKRVF
jgi:hypothetical protein